MRLALSPLRQPPLAVCSTSVKRTVARFAEMFVREPYSYIAPSGSSVLPQAMPPTYRQKIKARAIFRATATAREMLWHDCRPNTEMNTAAERNSHTVAASRGTACVLLMWQVRFYIAGLGTCVAGGPPNRVPVEGLGWPHTRQRSSLIKLCCRRFSP